MNKHTSKDERELSPADQTATVWLTRDNAAFSMKNGFLYLSLRGTEARAFPVRQFPFEKLTEYISIMNEEREELGIVRSLDELDEEARTLLAEELSRRYYAPVIKRILSMKERYGFSYWKVETEEGEVSFTLHDTYRSITRVSDDRILFRDVNGNRFEVRNVRLLDKKSYKKLELYL